VNEHPAAAIYEKYTHGLWSVALRIEHRPERIEDHLGETWLRALRFWSQCADEDKRFAWMCQILARVIYDAGRVSRRRRDGMHISLEDGIYREPCSRSQENAVIANIDLERGLANMHRHYRDEVLRRLADEGCGDNTQKVQFWRACQILRRTMGRKRKVVQV
jgi:DNA-directed RNA polymerase specialized sigma24 family protein